MIRRQLRIVRALMRVSLMTTLQYRSNFWLLLITGLIRTFAMAAPLWLAYEHTETIAGWPSQDAALVFAFFLLLHGWHSVLMEPNLGEVVEAIRQGTLDLWLLKPVDAQLLVSLRRMDPSNLWDFGAALLLGLWALSHQPQLTWSNILIALCLFVAGMAAMYGLWLIVICTSFFWIRVDNLRFLLMSVTDAGRWPLSVFGSPFRWVFTVIVPVGVVTTLPAEAIRGSWTLPSVGMGLGIGVLFLVGSRRVWKKSLSAYTSASS